MAKRPYRVRARERREQEILATAARLIHEQGYSNLNMDALADEVGISKSTLYQHFSSKEDMIVKVMLKSLQTMQAHMQQLDGDPLERLVQTLHYVMTTGHTPEGFPTMLVRDEMMKLFYTHSDIQRHMATIYEHLRQMIHEAREQGQIRDDIPEAVIASSMFGMLAILDTPAFSQQVPPAENLVDYAVSIWLRGITDGS